MNLLGQKGFFLNFFFFFLGGGGGGEPDYSALHFILYPSVDSDPCSLISVSSLSQGAVTCDCNLFRTREVPQVWQVSTNLAPSLRED